MQKRMPIGVDDFLEAAANYYLVDKTAFIKDFLDHHGQVTLVTRPRRFGKTLTMSMLDYFFSIEKGKQTKELFRSLAIGHIDGNYMKYQGTKPVIFMTLKGVENDTWPLLFGAYKYCVQREYQKYRKIYESGHLAEEEKRYFARMLDLTGSEEDYQQSLYKLSKFLHDYYHVKPIILLDEYDAPLQYAYTHGFYDEAITFFRSWFNNGLKSNEHLDFALLTGVLRLAKESIFSGLNNLDVCTVTGNKYAETFGFTEDDVAHMAADLGRESKLPELKHWYDGYRIGNQSIYNPWSVVCYFAGDCHPMPYWVNTSANDILHRLLHHADVPRIEMIHDLLEGKTVRVTLNESVIYKDIAKDRSALFTMLLTTGYLTIDGISPSSYNRFSLRIPNEEVRLVYSTEILNHLADGVNRDTFDTLFDALLYGDAREFEQYLQTILLHVVSAFDTAGKEAFYHGLLLGMTALFLDKDYEIRSNEESGYGRFDLAVFPKKENAAGVIMEFKVAENAEHLESKAQEALEQIEEKKYDTIFSDRNISKVWKYGISFCGKQVKVLSLSQ